MPTFKQKPLTKPPTKSPKSPAKTSKIVFPVLSNTPFKKKTPKAHKKDYLNINGYLFVEKLDSGGFGTVYKAEKNGEIVAVKVIKIDPNEEQLDSDLKRELAVLSQVEHEHIVHCYDIMRTAHRVYIFMEYASGGTVGKYVRKYGPLPVSVQVTKRFPAPGVAANHFIHFVHACFARHSYHCTSRQRSGASSSCSLRPWSTR